MKEVETVLSGLNHKLADYWLNNELIKRTIAISYDYWLEDTGIPMDLEDFVQQYLDHASYLGGIFSHGMEEID
ncbi:hypothetical protein [Neobacillus sp. Marseille-QA0830]